jgi:DNA replication and repair protein RecF
MHADRLSVARLTLSNFRCHPALRLETGAASVVVTGPNGIGKTSVLEALSLLAPGRGLRRARLDELAHRADGGRTDGRMDGWAPPAGAGWAAAFRLRTAGGEVDIGTGRDDTGAVERRQVRVDGQVVRSQAELSRICAVQWLTPEMDRLFVEGAAGRRRFLDRMVFGADPEHARRVSAYERALQERSRLLRDGGGDARWLAALEDRMATSGVAVAAARVQLAARLASASAAAGPFPAVTLTVAGSVEDWLAAGPALAAEDRLRAALAQSRRSDAESGGAAVGPHRSDLTVRHAHTGRPAAACSTGEQKALLIALVLAGTRLQRAERPAGPLLLLDEVAAHLDRRHRQALFEAVSDVDVQAWYAGTDAGVFRPLAGSVQFVTLGDGAAGSAQPATE